MNPLSGCRVEIECGQVLLTGKVLQEQGRMLHIALTQSRAGIEPIPNGSAVKLGTIQHGHRWQCESAAREWIWGRPPILVVGPVKEWREVARRRPPRRHREVHASLVLADGSQCHGRTRDFGESGLSLLVTAGDGLCVGAPAKLTLRTHDDVWCESLPVKITRVTRWLRSSGAAHHVAAVMDLDDDQNRERWSSCLRRLNSEEAICQPT